LSHARGENKGREEDKREEKISHKNKMRKYVASIYSFFLLPRKKVLSFW
jgi:hypothetical protein